MKISERQFHDGQLKERKRLHILRKLAQGKHVDRVELILRVGGDENLLHIVSPKEKDRLTDREKQVVLVGIAKDMEGARQVVKDIAEHVIGIHGTITGPLIDKEFDIQWKS